MPATPAWPPSSAPRLFVDEPLSAGATVSLDGPPVHYLTAVLRLREGAAVRLFDDRSGEWAARLASIDRRRATLAVEEQIRIRESVPDLWLLFATIKRKRVDWLVEKATELGVARLVPVTTRRTVVDRPNLARLRAHMIEAAEQCGRTALPTLDAVTPLESALATVDAGRSLWFADEGGGDPIASALRPGPAAILTGPEGGFTDEERAMIRAHPSARAVSLGSRILRADTAAVAALAIWMAVAGDWGRGEAAAG